jgi:hypothetical protein
MISAAMESIMKVFPMNKKGTGVVQCQTNEKRSGTKRKERDSKEGGCRKRVEELEGKC